MKMGVVRNTSVLSLETERTLVELLQVCRSSFDPSLLNLGRLKEISELVLDLQ